jgi:anti-sigma regulatory factor (Ser/Thr protein kinase)
VPTASQTFAGGLSSVRDARRFLSAALQAWDAADYDFGAPQVLSELATNAALHARSSYTVTVALDDDGLLLEVTDGSSRLPRARHYAPDATTGRGMGLVAALSLEWGASTVQAGKTVWARVAPDETELEFDLDELLSADEPVPVRRAVRRAEPRGASGSFQPHEAKAS